jgi:hypothetical protein
MNPDGKQVPFAALEYGRAASEKAPISHQFRIFK